MSVKTIILYDTKQYKIKHKARDKGLKILVFLNTFLKKLKDFKILIYVSARRVY